MERRGGREAELGARSWERRLAQGAQGAWGSWGAFGSDRKGEVDGDIQSETSCLVIVLYSSGCRVREQEARGVRRGMTTVRSHVAESCGVTS